MYKMTKALSDKDLLEFFFFGGGGCILSDYSILKTPFPTH